MGSSRRCLVYAALAAQVAWTAPGLADSAESRVLDIISKYGLNRVSEPVCREAIRKELEGKHGDACFGLHDKIVAGATITRAEHAFAEPTRTVRANTPGSWAYVQISSFGLNTADDVYTAVKEAKRQKVVFDLRHNGGGRVDQAFKIALLVADPKANQAIYTETRRDTDSDRFRLTTRTFHTRELAARFYADTPERVGALRDARIAVLIDEESFSTSEILAEILRRLNPERVILVGRRTYGKWTAQAWFPFMDDEGNERRLVYTARQYAPGADRMPPAHVVPTYYLDYSLVPNGDQGTAFDTVYRLALKKLARMVSR